MQLIRVFQVIVFLMMTLCGSAQVIIEALPRWLVSGHVLHTFPQEPINTFLTTRQVGYHLEAQYRLQYNKPFLAGLFYNEMTLSKYALEYVQNSGTGDINIREKANTRRLESGVTAGFYPEINWILQPYLQGRLGLAIFQTSSILTDQDSDESIDRISEYTTVVPSYGLDLGIHVVPNIWYLRGDIRVGVMGNPSTSYMLLNEDVTGSSGLPIDYFDLHTSAGSWLKISLGLSYLF